MLVILLISNFQFHPLPAAPHLYRRCLDVPRYIKFNLFKTELSRTSFSLSPHTSQPSLPRVLYSGGLWPSPRHPRQSIILSFPHSPRTAPPGLLWSLGPGAFFNPVATTLPSFGSVRLTAHWGHCNSVWVFGIFWRLLTKDGCQEWFQGCAPQPSENSSVCWAWNECGRRSFVGDEEPSFEPERQNND